MLPQRERGRNWEAGTEWILCALLHVTWDGVWGEIDQSTKRGLYFTSADCNNIGVEGSPVPIAITTLYKMRTLIRQWKSFLESVVNTQSGRALTISLPQNDEQTSFKNVKNTATSPRHDRFIREKEAEAVFRGKGNSNLFTSSWELQKAKHKLWERRMEGELGSRRKYD